MSEKNTGGPAFPTKIHATSGGIGFDNDELMPGATTHYSGMTLRDYFAAKALPAIYKDTCECARVEGWSVDWRDEVAAEAYDMADAMLKAREA